MLRLRFVIACVTGICIPSAALAQRYVDERVPFGTAFTASQSQLVQGDIDGDGWSELVVRDQGNIDWVLRGGGGDLTFVTVVEASDSNDSVVVDLNGDGRGDLLTQYFVSLGYYPGQAGATFGSFVSIQAEGATEGFWTKRAADVNNDGNVDVVCSLSTDVFGTSGVLRWFKGNGAGGFSSPQSTASTPYPIQFTLGDYDADGLIDAAATGPQGAGAFVFKGTGAAFAPPQPVAAAGAEARLLDSGDFDADGVDDLVCYPGAPSFTWFRGGAGGLSLGGVHALPGATAAGRDVVVADLEPDGDDDLLLVESTAGDGRVWRSLGGAGSGLSSPTIALAIPCSSVAAFEYDGNPGVDLAYDALSIKWPALRPGDGAAGFLEPVDLLASGACTDSDSVCAGDIDHDGSIDLAFESGLWLRGIGDGTFHPAAPLGARPSQLVDLNDDGLLDAVSLFAACGGQNGLYVALKSGPAFGAIVKPPQAPAGTLIAFAIADLDADGDLDLASAGPLGAYTHLNGGAATFASFTTTALPSPCANIGAGDLNGDGRADLARTNYVLEPFGGVTSATLAWGLSTGSGQVTAVQSKMLFKAVTAQLAIDDVNDDALGDVVWAQPAFDQIVAAHGDGAGNLGSVTVLSTQSTSGGLMSLALADIDGDGSRDALGGGAAGGQVSISRRTADGYVLWRQIGAGAGAGRILPYDFDADGQIDIAWGQGSTARIALNRKVDPAGTAPFGTGTFGCQGRASIGTVQPATVGNPKFRLLANHLPPHGTGWFLFGTGSSTAGIDPFSVGALLHVDPLPPYVFTIIPSLANSSGQAELAVPIPDAPLLAGATFITQAVHFGLGSLGQDCSTSPLSLVSSRGLALTIQP